MAPLDSARARRSSPCDDTARPRRCAVGPLMPPGRTEFRRAPKFEPARELRAPRSSCRRGGRGGLRAAGPTGLERAAAGRGQPSATPLPEPLTGTTDGQLGTRAPLLIQLDMKSTRYRPAHHGSSAAKQLGVDGRCVVCPRIGTYFISPAIPNKQNATAFDNLSCSVSAQ